MDIMAVKVASTREGVGGGANFGWIFELLVGLEEALHIDILRSWSLIIRKRQYREVPSGSGSLNRDQRSERTLVGVHGLPYLKIEMWATRPLIAIKPR